MHPLETYLNDLRLIHGVGVKETSYYSALANLFNTVGQTLKPKVRCIINPRNKGAGIPDGGLYTPDQLGRTTDLDSLPGLIPARGAIEVKGAAEAVRDIVRSEQVTRYLSRYGQVLVTNLRDFVLVGTDDGGKPVELESYSLAPDEAAFWRLTAHPRSVVEIHGERFLEYLRRVMLHAAPLASPQDVAWFLASYARDAKARVEGGEIPALAAVRTALEEALGLKFEGEKGEHFFRSTLVQTLFYGVFSAWVLWHRENPRRTDRFDWRSAEWYLHVPMIRSLYYQVASPQHLRPLGLVEVLDWTAAALNRVDRPTFFERFEEEHAVQYFYEPFLQAFDPELRKELGVWYTPPEIVKYMVARVDAVLREELEIEDGLADPRVVVLDPCCGTGAYLVEVLRKIAQTHQEKGADALSAGDIKRAAMERVFGFEILPAPFVVAHLQLGVLMHSLGAPLLEERIDENGVHKKADRVGVYLTNALTGWEPPTEEGKQRYKTLQMSYPELMQEREAADTVKRGKKILVVLGNPPYNAFAGVSPKEEQGLVEPYKKGLIAEWGIKKF
ncbi:MAG: N-6 DNA methylase, partial [Armatimonadetes bacterium]|nr:N-6 DNA methylase [Armatimonadota bacterium]